MRGKPLFIALLVAALLVTLAVPAVGKPGKGNGGGGSGGNDAQIALEQPPPYVLGQEVTFATSGSRSSSPWVRVMCYQAGTLVSQETNPVGGNYFVDDIFQLGPTTSWTAGDADCTAELGFFAKNARWRSEASMTFHVEG